MKTKLSVKEISKGKYFSLSELAKEFDCSETKIMKIVKERNVDTFLMYHKYTVFNETSKKLLQELLEEYENGKKSSKSF